MKKFILEMIFDFVTVLAFAIAIIALFYISKTLQPHKHTDKCLIEEKLK